MTDVIVSRIQNRRGLRKDLPQPLDPGEFGYCTDTGQLFIGGNAEQAEGNISPVIECFVPSTQSNISVNNVGQTQLVQIDLAGDIDDGSISIPETYVEIIRNDDGVAVRAYIGYDDAPGSLPGLGLGVERFFIDDNKSPSNRFRNSTLPLDSLTYSLDDANALSKLLNAVYENADGGRPGIVTVMQNVEVVTDTTSISDLLSNDISMPGEYIIVNETTVNEWVEIPELWYEYAFSDSFIMEYTLSNGVGNAPPSYSRLGTLKIVCGIDGDGELAAILTDEYNETTNIIGPLDLNFRATVKPVSGIDTIIIEYISTSATTPNDLKFVTNARRWKSFPVSELPLPVSPPT